MIDLLPFCSSGVAMIYDICRPFRQGNFVYATDGSVVVRVSPSGYDVTHSVVKPDMSEFNWLVSNPEWNPWPELCRERFDMYDLCECSGEDLDCDQCAGSGTTCLPNVQPIGELKVGGYYDRIIRPLPGIGWSPWSTFGSSSIAFRFCGGIGILMPLSGK